MLPYVLILSVWVIKDQLKKGLLILGMSIIMIKRMLPKFLYSSRAPAGWRGEACPTPKPKKIIGEKWSYFPDLYKMAKVQEDWIENG